MQKPGSVVHLSLSAARKDESGVYPVGEPPLAETPEGTYVGPYVGFLERLFGQLTIEVFQRIDRNIDGHPVATTDVELVDWFRCVAGRAAVDRVLRDLQARGLITVREFDKGNLVREIYAVERVLLPSASLLCLPASLFFCPPRDASLRLGAAFF